MRKRRKLTDTEVLNLKRGDCVYAMYTDVVYDMLGLGTVWSARGSGLILQQLLMYSYTPVYVECDVDAESARGVDVHSGGDDSEYWSMARKESVWYISLSPDNSFTGACRFPSIAVDLYVEE